ncbi:MAG: PglZ domain-containing protein [Acidimicrobiia bacterium]
MSDLRAALAEELNAKVKKHGVVVWDDPAREYVGVAAEVAPSDAVFERWDGSFYRLRRSVEPLLSDPNPRRLVIYLPCPSPTEDPLAEARDAGSVFTRRLNTLLERALKGRLTSARIDQIGRQAETIEQAEAVLDGDQGADARLVAAIGAASSSEMVRRLLTPDFDQILDEGDLWASAAAFLAASAGIVASERRGVDLRDDVFQDIVLRILDAAAGELPESLPAIQAPATARQLGIVEEAIALLRNGPDADQYRRLARNVDAQLGLASRLQWDRRLATCDITPAVDAVAFDAAMQMFAATRPEEAGALATTRLASSWWARPGRSGETGVEAKWRAVAALADLHDTARARPTGVRGLTDLLDWYVEAGWRVDAAHRRVESLRAVLPIDTDSLDRAFQAARAEYEEWLEEVLVAVSAAAGGADPGTNIPSQRDVHRQVESSEGPTVFVWVDALRYELGQALAERLRQLPATVEIRPAVATPPTVTPVGMASLLPDAAVHMSLVLSGSKVRVKFRDDDVKSVSDRVAELEQRHGTIANLRLTDAVQRGNDWLRSQVESSDLVLVRSQEIDQSGESDLLACTWGDFENVLTVLTTLVARFLHIGVRTVVITADHGFLALSRELGTDRLVDPPSTGTGELHRRAWIGIGGTVTDATVKVPLASFGVRSDLDMIIPKGLGVFRAGGGLQFFHGGLSPQELIVPVVSVIAHETPSEPARSITASLSGSRITTGIVVITMEVEGEPDLFGTTTRVRVQLTEGNEPCSRLIGGDDVDPATGTVEVTTQQPRVVTLQITRNLQAGASLNLDVIDAATGTRLSRNPVEVAADVTVEDDLG